MGSIMDQLGFEFYRAVFFGLANFALGLTVGLWFAERRNVLRLISERKSD